MIIEKKGGGGRGEKDITDTEDAAEVYVAVCLQMLQQDALPPVVGYVVISWFRKTLSTRKATRWPYFDPRRDTIWRLINRQINTF